MFDSPDVFNRLVQNHVPDVLCLQETKLQEDHVEDLIQMIPGYRSYWSCSTVKKGYSGTAVFIREATSYGLPIFEQNVNKTQSGAKTKQKTLKNMWRTPDNNPSNSDKNESLQSDPLTDEAKKFTILNVKNDLPDKRFNGEGRVITVEFDNFYLINCYVPNSGEGLVRLSFRVEEWDPYIVSYLNELRKTKPVIFAGDLNCGHLDLDIYNFEAKHIVKQAGLTPQERSSFSRMLEGGYFDAFRHFHPGTISISLFLFKIVR